MYVYSSYKNMFFLYMKYNHINSNR